MEDVNVEGIPFSVLMDRAVKLKQLQTKNESIKFNSYPSFLQNTIFPTNDDVIAARKQYTFSKRLETANQMKQEGNTNFREGRLDDALNKYEMALSVFRYLENTNPQWKSEGIKDKFIFEVEYKGKDEKECQQLNQFLVNCYNNIALVSIKMQDFSLAVKACDFAIAVDTQNDKSFYLRARARLAPKSSGAVDQELAKLDLQRARKHNPENEATRKQLQKLTKQIKRQKKKDKSTFKGLFDRGEIYNASELSKEKEASRRCMNTNVLESKQQDIILGRQLAQVYEERGMSKEKERLEQSLQHEMDIVQQRTAKMNALDFRNPSQQMILDAKSMGVDLNDPQTIKLLEEMKKKNADDYCNEQTVVETYEGGGDKSDQQQPRSLEWLDSVIFRGSIQTVVSALIIIGCVCMMMHLLR